MSERHPARRRRLPSRPRTRRARPADMAATVQAAVAERLAANAGLTRQARACAGYLDRRTPPISPSTIPDGAAELAGIADGFGVRQRRSLRLPAHGDPARHGRQPRDAAPGPYSDPQRWRRCRQEPRLSAAGNCRCNGSSVTRSGLGRAPVSVRRQPGSARAPIPAASTPMAWRWSTRRSPPATTASGCSAIS